MMRVELAKPGQNLALEFCGGRWISTFVLLPQPRAAAPSGEGQFGSGPAARLVVTRLVNRNRVTLPHLSPALRRICTLLLEPCGFFFERKMLLGIKERAERLASEREFSPAHPAGAPSHLWHGEHL